MRKNASKLVALSSLVGLTMPLAVNAETTLSYGGYIKLDALVTDYSDGDAGTQNLNNDFYVPGLIPTSDGSGEGETSTDIHAKESRLKFKTVTDAGDSKVTGYVELDFLVGPGGNERVSNSYNPRMRHAFLKYKNWLAGQTWSTFQDVSALAENLDFVGPAEGSTFVRQAQLRYTHGAFELALENPETTVTPNGGGGRIVTDDGAIPDIVGRYTARGNFGHIAVAAIVRQLQCENCAAGVDDSETAAALSVSGKLKVGAADDLRFMVSSGSGMGRYMALNTANAAVITANNELEAIDSIGGFVSYRHHWNDRLRSNLTLSTFSVDNDTALTGTGVTKSASSVHVNLIKKVAPSLEAGVELMFAERELENGNEGDFTRLQLSLKHSFGKDL